jgi:hypothetical protein
MEEARDQSSVISRQWGRMVAWKEEVGEMFHVEQLELGLTRNGRRVRMVCARERDTMKARTLIIGTASWVATVLLLLIFRSDLASILWIGNLVLQLGWLAWAVGLAVLAGVWMTSLPRVAGLCLLAVLGIGAFCFWGGRDWGERVRFAMVRSLYEQRLHAVLKEAQEGTAYRGKSRAYEVDTGPPVRVAFMWQGGVTDNWVGLVYDPTGLVMRANEFKRDWSSWGDPALESVRRLFGGDLCHTRHLSDHWYLCTFT